MTTDGKRTEGASACHLQKTGTGRWHTGIAPFRGGEEDRDDDGHWRRGRPCHLQQRGDPLERTGGECGTTRRTASSTNTQQAVEARIPRRRIERKKLDGTTNGTASSTFDQDVIGAGIL